MTYFKEHVTLSQEKIEEFWQVSFRESLLHPGKKVKMPERCIAARCRNVSNPKKRISMHKIPFLCRLTPHPKEGESDGSTLCYRRGKIGLRGRRPPCAHFILERMTSTFASIQI